jgi:acetyl-CoA synthetase
MIPEAVVAFYAVASLGAIAVPLFSGFAAAALASRVRDAGAKAVITADGTIRRGRPTPMRARLDESLADCPSVRLVLVVDNHGALGDSRSGGVADHAPTAPSTPTAPTNSAASAASADSAAEVVAWRRMLAAEPDPRVAPTVSSDVLLLAYTSGTTGRPKGAVHTHAGFLVRTACEVAYGFDMAPGRRFCWITDMGWIMGPLSIVGTHASGGQLRPPGCDPAAGRRCRRPAPARPRPSWAAG